MLTNTQTPAENLPYTAVLSPGITDTITGASWSASPTLTIGSPTTSGTASTVLVSGVQIGVVYILSCLLTGASGGLYQGFETIKGVATR